ncbi:Uncharacterized protein DBV15_00679 [Temnothorax longispinosus]|uniref:Uncharacterized protein n=1 Tax=Temnothorax longispinosus TaxID=300112 RepID=A0A4S2KMU5_9HYME|nr:Uncharacterized protein DBV15_00679 [Temnothorax longispinosus]
MSPGLVAVQEARRSDLCLLLDLLMIPGSRCEELRYPLKIAVRWVRATVLQVAQVTPTRPGALTLFHVVGISREAAVAWIVSDSKLVSFTSRHLGTGPTQHDTFTYLYLSVSLLLPPSNLRVGEWARKRDGDRRHRGVQCTDHAYEVHRDWPDPIHVAMVTFLRPSVRQHRELQLCRLIIPSTYSRAGYAIPTANVLPPPSAPAAPLTPPLTDRRKGSETRRERAIDVSCRMWDGEVASCSRRGVERHDPMSCCCSCRRDATAAVASVAVILRRTVFDVGLDRAATEVSVLKNRGRATAPKTNEKVNVVSPWWMTPSDCSRLRYLDGRSVTRPATDSGCDWSGLNRITGRAGLPRVFRKTPSYTSDYGSSWDALLFFLLMRSVIHPST